MSLTDKRDFKGLDFIKFIMAIFVVAIHTHPFEGMHKNLIIHLWNLVEDIAVPYFFIASGYLLFLKNKVEHDPVSKLFKIKQYTIRIFKLYLYWTIIFLPITIWKFSTNQVSFFIDILLFIRNIVLIGENYYSWPLWYLLSMIYSLIFIYVLIYRNQNTISIFIISVWIFLISSLINFIISYESTNHAVSLVSALLKNGLGSGRLLGGMLYIMIGALFASNRLQFSINIWILLSFIGIAFQVFRLSFVSSFLFPLLPGIMFYISLNISLKGLKSGMFFRKCSKVMYFTHMIVYVVYVIIFKEEYYFGCDAFLVSVLIPVLLTPIIIRYENRYIMLRNIL